MSGIECGPLKQWARYFSSANYCLDAAAMLICCLPAGNQGPDSVLRGDVSEPEEQHAWRQRWTTARRYPGTPTTPGHHGNHSGEIPPRCGGGGAESKAETA